MPVVRITRVLLAMLLAVGLAACTTATTPAGGEQPSAQPQAPQAPQTPQAPPAPAEIKVGYSVSRQGPFAAIGLAHDHGLALWAEAVNADGGLYVPEYGKKIPVKLIAYDDESKSDRMLSNYTRLIEQDKVHLLMSPSGTTQHIALAPLVEKLGIPVVGSTAASLQVLQLGVKNMFFTTGAVPDTQMQALVDLLKAHADQIKTVAIAQAQQPFPKENYEQLMPLLEQAGFQIVANKDYPITAQDLTPMILDLKSANPDAFINLSYPPDSYLVTKQAMAQQFNPKMMVQLVGPATDGYAKAFGKAADGVLFMSEWSRDSDWPGARDLFERHLQMFSGEGVDYLDLPLVYQAAQVTQQAVAAVGLDNAKLRDYIANNEFQTVRGPTRFQDGRNVGTPSMWSQWQDGKAQVVWPEQFASAKLLFPKPAWP